MIRVKSNTQYSLWFWQNLIVAYTAKLDRNIEEEIIASQTSHTSQSIWKESVMTRTVVLTNAMFCWGIR